MKYYAVKTGRQPGIYETWSECREQVAGYSGAAFKSFNDRQAAESYLLEVEEPAPIKEGLPVAFIDGSFSKKNQCYGWGGFIDQDGRRRILQGTGSNPDYMQERNIAGELIGALQIAFTCIKAEIPEINLYFDYQGIQDYVTGAWKSKTALARYYSGTMDLLQDDLKINYIKVAGHTGIEGNEIADYLAKEAVGAQLRKKDIAALESFRAAAESYRRGVSNA